MDTRLIGKAFKSVITGRLKRIIGIESESSKEDNSKSDGIQQLDSPSDETTDSEEESD
jgi:hypothetical protein